MLNTDHLHILPPVLWFRIHEGKNDKQKYKKVTKFHFLNAGCSLLGAEDFSCSLDVLYGCLKVLGKSK
jgi:hypothetical protein